MQFATPILGTALHEQCVSMGLIPPEGIDLKDGALFQHRPCFDPPGLPPGYLEKARAAFDMKIAAREAHKLIMNITYKCANRCVFCATGDRISAALGWDKIEEILRQHRDEGHGPARHRRRRADDAPAPRGRHRPRARARLSLDQPHQQRPSAARPRRSPSACVNSGITHLLISLHGATADVHEAATDAPGSFAETVAGIDNVMALRPAHVDTGINVTIVRANVDHLMALTALAVAKGFSKINFQFTTPFGRAWEDVVPPLEEAANAVMRVIDRYADEIDIHVINAQFCVFPGYERWVAGDLQKMGRTMVFAADPRFPEQVNLYEWLGARREKQAVCLECPVDDGVRGVPGVPPGQARHAGRAQPAPGGERMTATVVKLRDEWFEYADVLVDVMIGYACNVQCDYCSITDEMRKENMATAPVMAALAEARRRGATKVAFGGGEPTIRRSLLPLVRWCRDRGYALDQDPVERLDVLVRVVREGSGRRGHHRLPHLVHGAHRRALRAHHGASRTRCRW